ncbi:hypothetical protein NOF04DRAFT_6292 [Fusarium oxysporum II5]|uniref:Uncharacterized protein n=5 Tax=Fusarium oxysporum species complex TaxID=171631 RepID=N1R9R8_FUSC4|nr:uncharacterized protein FOIG_09467 [Fusarium odoratissimum NRRL 54006]EMT63038.1 hypothetical protein FOC4_g10013238 [Fusarium odoratissimum]KAK2129224.1 hypothetical protein NOF04DRAFT_6292 [Fusarium oxysporum II5]RKK19894.1 hypothetical protein BFJ65_g6603 [Fusarium oxysporum f. sp. cepae]RKK84449.1 hypothetical protein BFJ71_g14568 [Fusarium oxysporum]TXC00740.1 hypothetical protein FocTR4_00008037 [Fusarium oxysporum f. sp. cubense]
MKFTSTSLALLASIPLVFSLPTEVKPSEQLEQPQGFDKIQKADPEHWLQAVKEEAARQEAAAASTFNETEALEARASWIYQVHGMYTDNLVNVGDVDTFYMLWTRMYDSSDDKGGLSDITRNAWSKFCNSPYGNNGGVTTRFILDGQWGAVGRLSGWSMRDALIHSMWQTADGIGKKNGYTVYNGCYGFTWQESKPGKANSACGGRSGKACPYNDDCPLAGMECTGLKWGTWMPSIIRMNVYNRDGSLRADAYQARISSQAVGSGGCSKAQTISAYVADFIPIVGPYFATGIRINCLYQS